jgi:RNA polymerase sigma factor (sigma-70 family)
MTRQQGPLCALAQPCICNECLTDCLEDFIPRVLTYLLRRRIEEDVAIEACSHAWEKAVEWINNGTAATMTSAQRRGYLCRAAYNIACDHLRRQSRSPLGRAMSLSHLHRRYEPTCGMDQFEEAADEATLLKRCLASLNKDDRSLLELYYCDDATFAQLADVLGCGEATAWRRVNTALDRLRDLFLRASSES